MPSPTVWVSTRRIGFLSLVSPKRCAPAPSTTGKIFRRSSSSVTLATSGRAAIRPTQPPRVKPSSPAGSSMTPSSETFSLMTIFPISDLLASRERIQAELLLCQWRYAGRPESNARLRIEVVREPEPREELRTDERGHLVDSLCAQREHGHAARLEDLPLVVPAVVAERQLSVRACWDDAPAHVGGQHVVGQEGADRLAPTEPGGPRRHRERAVGGEHFDDGVDVGALEGVDVAVDELAQVPVAQ